MDALSTKVPKPLAIAFAQWASDAGMTTSAALRMLVAQTVKVRPFEVYDPEIGPPIGRLYIDAALFEGLDDE